MTIRITKQFDFQMAHALKGYDGKCSNIHGHNFKLMVTVQGVPIDDPRSAKNGMVMDYVDLKRIVNERLIQQYDHALVLPEGSPFAAIQGTKIIVVPFQPTSENLLVHFARLLEGSLPEGVSLQSLRLYETDTSYAELILD